MQDFGGARFAATTASLLLAWAGTAEAGTVRFEATESRREFSVEISGYQQVCPRYDGLKKENSLLSMKLGNLYRCGKNSAFASFPQYGESHGL